MKIRNLARFLVLVLMVVSGSIPVLAQESSPCGSVDPITPGDRMADVVSDVPAAHIDITGVNSSLSGETLTVVFHLRDLPGDLDVQSNGVWEGHKGV